MGWYIAGLVSGDKGGCSRVSGKSNYMIINLSSANDAGIEQAKSLINYFDGKEKYFSKFLKYNDKLGDKIQIDFISHGACYNLFKGNQIMKNDYDKIYNKLELYTY